MCHYVIASHFTQIPPWADEGLATFFEKGAPYDRPRPELLRSIVGDAEEDAAGVLRGLIVRPSGAALRSREYALAWSLTHLLTIARADGPDRFRQYLENVRADRDAMEQFTEVFGDFERAAQAWARHVSEEAL